MSDGMTDTPKEELSIHSGSNDNGVVVETVVEPDGVGDDDGEGDEGFHGNVASTTRRNRRRASNSGSSVHSDSNSSSSSRSSLIRQKKQERKRRWSSIKKNRNQRDATNSSADIPATPPRPGLQRSKTPTTNNLSTASGGFFSEYDDSIEGEDLTASLLPPTLILDGEAGGGRVTAFSPKTRRQQNPLRSPQRQQQLRQPPPSGFRKALAEGMLDTLNAVAGITLSTTGTILSPPIALTKNIILPSVMAILVDTLDTVTPYQVQDWFRILTSSVYHFFVVLVASSTERGIRYRNKVTTVATSFLEAWSAPESRQVVVDGMATGVKLADALHTPEMKMFLDQLGVLGCRVVDAMSSGKSKEFLLNSKDLIWASIELACDPSATAALAEVTAHLCHALKEVDDSFNGTTPRAVRDAHNKETYLNSSLMTRDYPMESMEKIILASLGMDGNDGNNNNNNNNESIDSGYDTGDGMDNDSTEQSIPSNVAFRVEGGAENNNLDSLKLEQTNGIENDDLNYQRRKDRVDVDLLKRKILDEGRPRARPSMVGGESRGGIVNFSDRQEETSSQDKERRSFRAILGDMSENYAKVEEDMEDLPLLYSGNPLINLEQRNPTNEKELYDKFERMETKESDQPPYVQFFNAVDELLNKNRMEKENYKRDYAAAVQLEGNGASGNSQTRSREQKARVRVLRKGVEKEEKFGSRTAREKYANFRRRLWKYPPSLLRFTGIVVAFFGIFWIGFGIYGMYAFFNQVVFFDRGISLPPSNHGILSPLQQQQQLPSGLQLEQQLPPLQQQQQKQKQEPPQQPKCGSDHESMMSSSNTKHDNRRYEEKGRNYHPNEIVIRIVKEVVHVREDGSRLENYKKTTDSNLYAGESSKENQEDDMTIGDSDGIEENNIHSSAFSEEGDEDANISDEYDIPTDDVSEDIGENGISTKNYEDKKEGVTLESAFSPEEIYRVRECLVASLAEAQDDDVAIEEFESEFGDDMSSTTLTQEEIDNIKECVSLYA